MTPSNRSADSILNPLRGNPERLRDLTEALWLQLVPVARNMMRGNPRVDMGDADSLAGVVATQVAASDRGIGSLFAYAVKKLNWAYIDEMKKSNREYIYECAACGNVQEKREECSKCHAPATVQEYRTRHEQVWDDSQADFSSESEIYHSPFESADQVIDRQTLRKAIQDSNISPRNLTVFYRAIANGESVSDIAQEMGISATRAYQILDQVRNQVAKQL